MGGAPVLLTLDSVDPQALPSFQATMEECQTYPLHGPCNATHVWQAIDRHIGKMWKDLYSEEQMDYLSEEDNWQNFDKLSASSRRILVTH